jgi:hypothetical protein
MIVNRRCSNSCKTVAKEETMSTEPLYTPKAEYEDIVTRISLPDSPVGIDAQYTHAIIITYLRQIAERLDRIESRLAENS